MKEIINSNHSRLFLSGLALTIICAWFSVGAYYPDEHFSYLEFCSYKIGNPSDNSYSLPWEFFAKIRASLLPCIAYVFAKCMDWCGFYNPFTLIFLLRLFTGFLCWFITCRFCLLQLPKFNTSKGGRLLILMSLFLWFMPFLTVRFTAENTSGILLIYGIYCIISIDEKNTNAFIKYSLAGLFFGISFFIRVQIIFAIAGFVVWLIFIHKIKWKYIFALAISVVVAAGINILIDSWFYGEWTFVPFNNYYQQIIQHKAVQIGAPLPWWFYAQEFITNAISPLGWLLLSVFLVGVYKNPKNPLVWAIIPFLAAHCYIDHKEFRYTFPVIFPFLYIISLGFDYLLYQPQIKRKKLPIKIDRIQIYYQKIHKYVYLIGLVICIPVLLFRTFAPVQVSMYYNKFLYDYNASEKNTPLFFIPNRIGDMYFGLNTSFYKNPDLKIVLVDSIPEIGDYLRNNYPKKALFFSYSPLNGVNDRLNYNGYKIKMVYCFFQSWMLKYDIFNWKERIPTFSIYQFTPIASKNEFDVNKLLQEASSFQNPGVINLLLNSAYSSLQNGKLDDAEKILTSVKGRTQGISVPNLHNYHGLLYFKKNMTKDAKKEFNTEIALNLRKEEAYLYLGMLYFHDKDYDNAIKSMDNLIRINPNNAYAFNNLGVYFLYIQKEYTKAMQYFEKAVSINPYYGQAYVNIKFCSENIHDEQALKYVLDNRRDLYINYGLNHRILVDTRNDLYTWVNGEQKNIN